MSWWRRNRWALFALLPALALALVASSDRVSTYFWSADLRDARQATQGVWLEHRDRVLDVSGVRPIDLGVRLDGVHGTDAGWESASPLVLPPGTHAVRVDLTLRASPDEPLRTCLLAVRDADGTRYDYDWGAAGGSQPASPCVPSEAPGPYPEMEWLAPDPDAPVRPQEWRVSPVLVVPDDVEITEVLLWWGPPTYLALSVG
jgi:hypothetical protein